MKLCFSCLPPSVVTVIELFLPPAIVSVALAAVIGMNSPPNEEFSYKQDFTESGSDADFIFTDPTAWRINANGDNRYLELLGPSKYTPPFRSPSSIALIGTHRLREFVLETDLLKRDPSTTTAISACSSGFRIPLTITTCTWPARPTRMLTTSSWLTTRHGGRYLRELPTAPNG